MQIISDSFQKIWAGLTDGQRFSLTTVLIQEGCCTTRQTVWNWANNKTKPSNKVIENQVARIIGKVVGSRVLAHTLFPHE